MIGLAAFFVYWNLERPGIDRLIGRKIYKLDDDKIKEIENAKLDGLKAALESTDKRVNEKVSSIKTMAENKRLNIDISTVKTELDATLLSLRVSTSEVAELKQKLATVSTERAPADSAPVVATASEQKAEDSGQNSIVDVRPSAVRQSFFNLEPVPATSVVPVVILPEAPNKDESSSVALPAAAPLN